MSTKKPQKQSELDKHADAIRTELAVPKQNDVFRAAVEGGFLAALADGAVDDAERAAIARAVEVLSKGAVIEWEVEALLDEVKAAADKDGPAKRADAVGAKLKSLGQPDAGILFAAFVAQATGGIDGREAKVLEAIGKAAGVSKGKVNAILKKVGAAVEV